MSEKHVDPESSGDWKTQAADAWRSFAKDKRRLWISIGVVAVLAGILIWALQRPNAYVDGVGVSQDASWAALRDVVWDEPSPLVPDLNATSDFYDPTVSANNLSLIFVKGRPGEGADLWTMDWSGDEWTNLRPLENLNTTASEIGPDLTPDGQFLYFSSDREGGLGGFDLWVSRRNSEGQWGAPVNLGANLNSAFHEYDPAFHAFSGKLYFSSNRPKRELTTKEKDSWKGTMRELRFEEDYDLFSAVAEEGAPDSPAFGQAERVEALNSNYNEGQTTLSARGDFLYFSSDRVGGEGGYDLYRSRVYEGEILPPENLGRPANTSYDDMDPTLTMEGHRLLFSSDREQAWQRESGVRRFAMYQTISREVMPTRLDDDAASGFWAFVDNMKWWILLLVASMIALYFLLRKWSQAKNMGAVGIRTRCMIGSILFHVLLALLFSLKQLVEEVIEQNKEATVMEANLDVDALALEKEALDLREETTELPNVEETNQLEVEQQFAPSYEEPTDSAETPSSEPIEGAFVLEAPPATQMDVPSPTKPTEQPAEELTKPQTQPLNGISFALPTFRLEQTDPAEAQAEPEFQQANDTAKTSRAEIATEVEDVTAEKATTSEIQDNPEIVDSSAVQATIEAPESTSEPIPESLAKFTDVQIEPAETPAEISVSLETKRQSAPTETVPEIQAPALDPSTAKAVVLDSSVEPTDSPEIAKAEIRGGEPSKATSAVNQQAVPKQSSEESDLLENLTNLPLSDALPTPNPSASLRLEGPIQREQGDDAPDVAAPSADAAIAEAAGLVAPDAPDQAKASATAIQDGALSNVSAAPSNINAAPLAKAAADALAAFKTQPAPLGGGPKVDQLTSNLNLENSPDLAGGPAEAEIASVAADSGIDKQAELSSAKIDEVAAPSGLSTPTGLNPTESAVLRLPQLSLNASSPNPSSPNLANPVILKLPVSGGSPKLALESKPSTVEPFLLRDPKQRARVLERLGGTEESEEAITRALDWFSKNQEPDGRWSINKHGGQKGHDVASTSFALVCYFGWGAKHNDPASPYHETVNKGLNWLLKQVKDNGDLTGGLGNGMYDQGIATLALAEAYGLTKDEKLREPLEKAVEFVVKAQNKTHGAWDYRPNTNRKDSSVSGWQLMALNSARLAGIKIENRSFDLAGVWLDQVSSGDHKGKYGYDNPGNKPAMTALGMFSQQLLGKHESDHPRMLESSKAILGNLKKGKLNDFYFVYYGCLSMYMNQGEPWEKWNPVMRESLLKNQVQSGKDEGSWDYKGGSHSKAMGRVITTAIATLSLEVYYRYLPSAKVGAAQVPGS